MRYGASRTAKKPINVGQLEAEAQLEAHGQIPRLYTYAPRKQWDAALKASMRIYACAVTLLTYLKIKCNKS